MQQVYARTANTVVIENGFIVDHEAAARRGMMVIMPHLVIQVGKYLELWYPNDDSPEVIEYKTAEDAAHMAAQWTEKGIPVHVA